MMKTMKNFLVVALLFFIATSFDYTGNEATTEGQEIKAVKFKEIQRLMDDDSGDLQVINFWATWCGPCVKEMPSFEKAREKYAAKGVKFTLVSLDFKEDLENKVIPFVNRKKIKSDVILLDNVKYDTWIGKVDDDWEGEIPVTLFVNKKKGIRYFVKAAMEFEELDATIARYLK
ncbi:MAG: TlpA disulfide reductase family protein [Flammeovirgaceae bacterium]